MTIPELRWIGVKSDDVTALDVGTMVLTQNGRVRAQKLLESMHVEEEVVPEMVVCRSELQKMLMLNMKAEIQVLDTDAGRMRAWLEDKIVEALIWS